MTFAACFFDQNFEKDAAVTKIFALSYCLKHFSDIEAIKFRKCAAVALN